MLPVTLLYDNPTPALKSVKEIPEPPVAVESAAGAHSVPTILELVQLMALLNLRLINHLVLNQNSEL